MSVTPPRKPAGIDERHEKAGCVQLGVAILWVPSALLALGVWSMPQAGLAFAPFAALLAIPNVIAGVARGPLGVTMRTVSLVIAALLCGPCVLSVLGLR